MEELQCVGRDKAEILRHEQFEKVFEYLRQGISSSMLKATLFKQDDSLEPNRKRKISYDIPGSVPAILRLPKLRHGQLAAKWAFGRFPPLNTTLPENKFGDIVPRLMGIVQNHLSR